MGAGFNAVSDRARRGGPVDTVHASPRHVATAGVHIEPLPVGADAGLDDPVRHWGSLLLADLLFLLALLKGGDPGLDLVEFKADPGLQGAEAWQVRGQVGHVSSLHLNSNRVSTGGMSRRKTPYPSDTQVRVLREIRAAIADRGEAPSLAELAAATGLGRSTVHYQLRELQAKGALVVEPRRARGIRLT